MPTLSLRVIRALSDTSEQLRDDEVDHQPPGRATPRQSAGSLGDDASVQQLPSRTTPRRSARARQAPACLKDYVTN